MSDIDASKFIIAIILSLLFTVTLFYLTFEVPHLLDNLLHSYYPDVFWEPELREQILNNLRPYGYLTLIITFMLIVLGFIVKKNYLSTLGSIAIYLPIFGYFAFAMFFLAGIGVLRILWLPLLEFSPNTLKLGHIVLLPFLILKFLPDEYFWYGIIQLIGIFTIGLGLLIFSLGVITWFYGRFRRYKLINFWIYRYSRHPQYLGFLLWSYGLLLFIYFKPYVKGAFTISPTLPWLISSMIVIGVALDEEIEIKRKYDEEYINYCKKVPFMIPLPKLLSDIITKPSNLFIKGSPRDRKDIVTILIIYLLILIILSFITITAFNL